MSAKEPKFFIESVVLFVNRKNISSPSLPSNTSYSFFQKGLSFIELLFTMLIAGIVAAISFSNPSSVKNQLDVNRVGNQIEDTLKFARSYALSTGLKVGICPTDASAPDDCIASPSPDDWSGGWLVYSYVTSGGTIETKVLKYSEPKAGVEITAAPTRITVNGLGFAVNGSSFTFQDLLGDNTTTLDVSRALNVVRS